MKIVVNAVTVKYGGGLTVTLNFLRAAAITRGEDELFLITARGTGMEGYTVGGNVTVVPAWKMKYLFRPWLDHVYLRRIIKAINPDVIISMGNLPLPVKGCQVILFDNPFGTLRSFNNFRLTLLDKLRHRLRNYFFVKRIKYLNSIIFQTEIEQRKFQEKYARVKVRQWIIPNPPGLLTQSVTPAPSLRMKKDEGERFVVAFTRYYPHKNLEILLHVAELIRDRYRIKILLTIQPGQHPHAAKMLRLIRKRGLENVIINTGEIAPDQISHLYRLSDALVLPTLLESFTSTYTDAMLHGVPVLTSDRDFARHICGDAAWYFNPADPHDILKTICCCFENQQERQKKIERGLEMIRTKYPDWFSCARQLLDLASTNNQE